MRRRLVAIVVSWPLNPIFCCLLATHCHTNAKKALQRNSAELNTIIQYTNINYQLKLSISHFSTSCQV